MGIPTRSLEVVAPWDTMDSVRDRLETGDCGRAVDGAIERTGEVGTSCRDPSLEKVAESAEGDEGIGATEAEAEAPPGRLTRLDLLLEP